MACQLSVIIVTYNSERLIFDCLDSIYKYNDIGDELEVIVVDNCSINVDDMFLQIKLKYQGKVILINSPINGGYGHGNNQGVKVATAPLVAVMNPDVRIVGPIYNKIIDKFNSDLNIGMMGVRFVDGSRPLYFKPEYSTLFRLVFSKLLLWAGLYKIEHIFFSGSFLIFDKSVFIKAGMFDENIFMYHEEADISNRIIANNKSTLLYKDLAVLHLAHGRKVNYNLLRIASISRDYYFKKYNANIEIYYKKLLIIYRVKYVISILVNNQLKREEFKAWIKMCKSNGKI